jgi:hypothetical protein
MPMFTATTRHPISSKLQPGDVQVVTLPEFQDAKSLGAALRAARLLPSGVRVREWRREGDKIHVFPTRCPGIHCVSLEPLAPIEVSSDGQTLTILSSEPGQTIDAGDVTITTTLHRLG